MYVNTSYFQIFLVLNYILAAENDTALSTVVASTALTVYMMYLIVDISKEYALAQNVVATGLFGCFCIHTRLIDFYNSMLTYRLMVFGTILLVSFAGAVGFAEQTRRQRLNSFMDSFINRNNKEKEDDEEDSDEDDDSDEEEDNEDNKVEPPVEKQPTQPTQAEPDVPSEPSEPNTTCLMYCGDHAGYEAIVRGMFKDRRPQTLNKCAPSPDESAEPAVFETHADYLKEQSTPSAEPQEQTTPSAEPQEQTTPSAETQEQTTQEQSTQE
jgi:FtsZ-interacting cell division protein ZipA